MNINISIDFEDERHYFRTLGIPFDGKLNGRFYRYCTDRFLEIFGQLNIKATFFIIGKDIDENVDVLKDIIRAGHQIGNHSYEHSFVMSAHSEEEQHSDILKTHNKIKEALGVEAKCYRAPCYDITYANIRFLKSLGYTCDSSFYPSNLACLQKVFYKLYTRRPVSMGPSDVHRFPPKPFYIHFENGNHRICDVKTETSLLEVPIPYFTFLQLPLYSTPQYVLGKNFIIKGIRSLLAQKIPFTYELHSLDLACGEKDGLDNALKRIPQMRVSLKKKTEDLKEIFKIFKNEANIVSITELL